MNNSITSDIHIDDIPKDVIPDATEADLTHDQMLEVTQSSLATLLRLDSLLSDIPDDVMLEEVLAQIAVEHGQSITIFLSRESEPTLKIVVPQDVTVIKLKKAISRHYEIYQHRIKNKMKISWKYIWRTYNLHYDGVLLDDDNGLISDYGVGNKTTLRFKKKLRNKRVT